MLIKFPKKIDKEIFKYNNEGQTKYGLPKEVLFCKSCVISNQRPNSSIEFKNKKDSKKNTINFDENLICDACKVKDKKAKINWELREQELKELCEKFRKNDGTYDCLVPGSGGKDSFMQAHLLKYKYGMNPLTCTWAPHIYTDWGWRNHQAWIHAGFDNILFTPNGRVHRLLTRLAVDNLLHPFQPFILGQKNLAPKIAKNYGISLIFYGENEAEYGNPLSDMSQAIRDKKYLTIDNQDEIVLGGSSLHELYEMGLKKGDLDPYFPVSSDLILDNNIQVHYLGYYIKWHPQNAYYYSVENGGFESSPERTAGTYSTYNSIDDRIDDFHYHTTWIKFGIGRATYDAAQEIRSGELTREEGVALVNKYDGEFPLRWSDQIFDYLTVDKENFPKASQFFEKPIFDRNYYDLLCDQFRSPHLWKWDEEEGWQLRHIISNIKGDQSDTAKYWVGNN
ncbi:LPS biosynthesis protein PseA [bacterium]|nr:LPS biosynthesis protein PseA [bacterium]